MESGISPTSSGSFAPFKDSDYVKGLFLGQGVDGDGACWTGANDGNAFDRRNRHDKEMLYISG